MRAGSRTLALGLLVALLGCATGPPPAPPTGEVRVVGSDTMLPLNRRLAERFMADRPGVAVVVTGGGTRVGFAALVEGRAELCAASRPATADEVRKLFERHKTLGERFLIARDALSVYLHPSNPLRSLSLAQLRGLFAGEITDWEEVGGRPGRVLPVVRPPTSGTAAFFRDVVLGELAYTPSARLVRRTRDVVETVRSSPGAVGYGGVSFAPDLVHCAVEGVAPSPESVRDGSYPLARYLSLYATGPPAGALAAFVEWCLGPSGQEVVAEVGYVPLWVGE